MEVILLIQALTVLDVFLQLNKDKIEILIFTIHSVTVDINRKLGFMPTIP